MDHSDAKSAGRQAVERLSGSIKKMAGALLHDDGLVDEGTLEQRRVDVERESQEEFDEATRRDERAHVRIREAELAAERAQLAAEEQAEADRLRIARREELAAHSIEREREYVEADAAAREAELHGAVQRAESAAEEERRRQREAALRMDRAAHDARRRADEVGPDAVAP
jgi:hypothetical protein